VAITGTKVAEMRLFSAVVPRGGHFLRRPRTNVRQAGWNNTLCRAAAMAGEAFDGGTDNRPDGHRLLAQLDLAPCDAGNVQEVVEGIAALGQYDTDKTRGAYVATCQTDPTRPDAGSHKTTVSTTIGGDPYDVRVPGAD
jgi:hypothetical protein